MHYCQCPAVNEFNPDAHVPCRTGEDWRVGHGKRTWNISENLHSSRLESISHSPIFFTGGNIIYEASGITDTVQILYWMHKNWTKQCCKSLTANFARIMIKNLGCSCNNEHSQNSTSGSDHFRTYFYYTIKEWRLMISSWYVCVRSNNVWKI
jgi:hypothetical protein